MADKLKDILFKQYTSRSTTVLTEEERQQHNAFARTRDNPMARGKIVEAMIKQRLSIQKIQNAK